MKIYLACGLTHVPRENFDRYVAIIHYFATGIETCGAEVKYPLKNSDPQLAVMPIDERARLCYEWDRNMVEWADLIVAECTYPSIGVGIEMQIAEQKKIPVLILFNSVKETAGKVQYCNPDGGKHWLQIGEGHVTLMALGMPNVVGVLGYKRERNALNEIFKAIAQVKKNLVIR